MRLVLECWDHAFSKISARHRTTIWSFSLLLMHNTSSCSTPLISTLMKASSLLLSFLIDQMLMSMFVSLIPISIERGTWSEGFCNSGCKECRPKPKLLGGKKMRSSTEFMSHRLSAYLVGPGFMGGITQVQGYQQLKLSLPCEQSDAQTVGPSHYL